MTLKSKVKRQDWRLANSKRNEGCRIARRHRTGRYEAYRRAACFFRAALFAGLGGCCFAASCVVFWVAGCVSA